MSITGAGSITAANIRAVTNMNNQLDQLSTELGTGEAAQTYSGLGSQAGVALSLAAQLSALNGYSNTATSVGTTLSIAQSALSQIASSGSAVAQSISSAGTFALDGSGQTKTQVSAAAELSQILSALGTQVGANYIFSGSAVNQSPVASESAILNGSGSQAGLTQVISERQQADAGANGLGRVSIGSSGSQLTVSHDTSVFGFQLAGITSSTGSATITGPSGSPPAETINLAANPSAGDTVNFSFTMPDGSSQTVTLTATTDSPPGTDQFTIGSDPTATASNLAGALTAAVSSLAQTALPAASAIEAANNFFTSDPPVRVDGPPFDTATSLVNGTSANTVFWYTGGSGSTPARQTQVAQVGPSETIAYGMQANEPGISSIIANVAALAATSYSASDPNAQASYDALAQQVSNNLSGQSGTQSINDIEADLANAQTVMKNAGTLNTQTETTLQNMLQNIEGVNQEQIGEQILALQNSLSASLSVTARLAQLSLVNYLGPSSG